MTRLRKIKEERRKLDREFTLLGNMHPQATTEKVIL